MSTFFSALWRRLSRLGAFRVEPDELAVNRRRVIVANNASGVSVNLVGGSFITGLLLLLGADNAFMGVISMIGFLGNLFQIFAPLLLERFERRKTLLIACRVGGALINVVLVGVSALLPLEQSVKLMLILSALLAFNIISALATPGLMVWHIKSVPDSVRARFFALLNATSGAFVYLSIFLGSQLVDLFRARGSELTGLIVLRGIALVMVAVDFFFLLRVKEYPTAPAARRIRLRDLLLLPLREPKYLITTLMSFCWSFAFNLPGPYYTIYMLRDMGVSYSFLNSVGLANIPIILFIMPLWRRRIDRNSWTKTLAVAMAVFLLHYIGLAFVSPSSIALYPVTMIFAFLILPGVQLALANLPYMNIPAQNQTVYIGFFAAASNLAALLGVFCGRAFVGAAGTVTVLGFAFGNKQLLMLLTAAVMLVGVVVISTVGRKLEKG